MTTWLSIALLALAAYCAYVVRLVVKNDTAEHGQKALQVGLILLFPLAGAALVHWVLVGQARDRDAPSNRYTDYPDYTEHEIPPKIYNDD
ncbi:hypothetical protein E4O92_10885 [Massilia horti]|uniref:Cardiolipin synthase N-terminal domain-containing protein n=1 Tax=Massilia horti TaxID=2562153 RepID=A0A4Y9T576_9BURK|nr:hypothetical protein E4O92_10885 [Massilia horti]